MLCPSGSCSEYSSGVIHNLAFCYSLSFSWILEYHFVGFVRKNVFQGSSLEDPDLPVLDVPFPSAYDHYRLSLFNAGARSGHAGIAMHTLLSLGNKIISEKQKKCYEMFVFF